MEKISLIQVVKKDSNLVSLPLILIKLGFNMSSIHSHSFINEKEYHHKKIKTADHTNLASYEKPTNTGIHNFYLQIILTNVVNCWSTVKGYQWNNVSDYLIFNSKKGNLYVEQDLSNIPSSSIPLIQLAEKITLCKKILDKDCLPKMRRLNLKILFTMQSLFDSILSKEKEASEPNAFAAKLEPLINEQNHITISKIWDSNGVPILPFCEEKILLTLHRNLNDLLQVFSSQDVELNKLDIQTTLESFSSFNCINGEMQILKKEEGFSSKDSLICVRFFLDNCGKVNFDREKLRNLVRSKKGISMTAVKHLFVTEILMNEILKGEKTRLYLEDQFLDNIQETWQLVGNKIPFEQKKFLINMPYVESPNDKRWPSAGTMNDLMDGQVVVINKNGLSRFALVVVNKNENEAQILFEPVQPSLMTELVLKKIDTIEPVNTGIAGVIAKLKLMNEKKKSKMNNKQELESAQKPQPEPQYKSLTVSNDTLKDHIKFTW